MSGIIIDITDRKQAEAMKDRLMAAVEQSAEGIVITNAEGVIEYVNPAFEQMTGYSRADAIGNKPSILKSGKQDEAFYADLWRNITSGEIWRGQMVNRRKDGELYTESDVISPVKDGTGKIVNFVAAKTDISETLLREEKSQQIEKMVAIGQLAGGIAHDFNNQLSGILGYADLLAENIENDTLKSYATNIMMGAERAADLTAKLLAFSRKGKVHSVPVRIHGIIESVTGILEHSIDKRITIRKIFNADNDTTVGDSTQLQNAILNIAINARDAMPDGGEVIFETSVAELDLRFLRDHIHDAVPGAYLKISVTDNGSGMDAETQKHIFEPFYTTKGVGKGTGMGLASVYGTIQNHKGVVVVHSEEGLGTTFNIYLPLIKQACKTESVAGDAKPVMGTARILLVEDEEMVREFVTDALKSLGYQVTTCANGKEALECYETSWREIDLVILDMIMPVMGGKEAFVLMKKINPGILAIFSSGYSLDNDMQAILDEGVKAFVGKPYRVTELSKTITKVLSSELTLRSRNFVQAVGDKPLR